MEGSWIHLRSTNATSSDNVRWVPGPAKRLFPVCIYNGENFLAAEGVEDTIFFYLKLKQHVKTLLAQPFTIVALSWS